eukprot:scaffold5180_cov74-Skeletonema_marinoi.AAC.3
MKLLFCGGYFTTYSYVNSTESSESSQITKGGRMFFIHHHHYSHGLLALIIQQTTFPLPSCILSFTDHHHFHSGLLAPSSSAFMMMAADGYYIYNGGDGEVIPPGVTRVRIHESVTVIPANAFYENRTIEELECHDRVKTVGGWAFYDCTSLRVVIMPGVEVVERYAFCGCDALADVECDKLEIIGESAFGRCESLTIINLPSAKIIEDSAFYNCRALTNVEFGKELESIEYGAFFSCTSLERITIPLKDNMITHDSIFQGCKKLKHVDLVEEAVLRRTIDALLLEEWKNDMDREMLSIHQILSYTSAGNYFNDVGGKALVIRMWIRAVLGKIIHYKAQHQSLLNETAFTLQHAFPQDIVIKSVLPFLELPNMNVQR